MSKMMDGFSRIARAVDRICRLISCILLISIVVVTFAQIICRRAFHSPLVWSEELSRLMFVWLSCIGSTIAVRNKSHIQFDFLVDRINSGIIQGIVRIVVNLTIITCFLFIVPSTISLVKSMNTIPSAALSWPSGIIHIGYLLGILTMVVAFVEDCLEAVKEMNESGVRKL